MPLDHCQVQPSKDYGRGLGTHTQNYPKQSLGALLHRQVGRIRVCTATQQTTFFPSTGEGFSMGFRLRQFRVSHQAPMPVVARPTSKFQLGLEFLHVGVGHRALSIRFFARQTALRAPDGCIKVIVDGVPPLEILKSSMRSLSTSISSSCTGPRGLMGSFALRRSHSACKS